MPSPSCFGEAMRITELPWHADPTRRFQQFADQPWSVLLDSCHDQSGQGRFDIFAAAPYATFEATGSQAILGRGQERQILRGNPFALLKQQLAPMGEPAPDLPFCGGAIGYFSYELGRTCVELSPAPPGTLPYPELAVGLYDWAVIGDHQRQQCFLVSQGRAHETQLIWDELVEKLSDERPAPPTSYHLREPLRSNLDQDEYGEAFTQVRRHIEAGDCYQVNLAQRFAAPSEGRLWSVYPEVRQHNPAPFSAYFHHPQVEIASASPERFLQVRDGRVETRPIKGTMRRIPGQESEHCAQLRDSVKDRAENLMIVDLLRNDLGKNCMQGSVTVPELFTVESFATVHHLVSTITGEVRPGRHALEVLEGCFPGGSITGAPKRCVMEIIERLERTPRGIYCGSLAYIGLDGNMDSSIAIRTIVQANQESSLHAGGGLTHGSQMDAEYQECLDKAAAMRTVLESCLC